MDRPITFWPIQLQQCHLPSSPRWIPVKCCIFSDQTSRHVNMASVLHIHWLFLSLLQRSVLLLGSVWLRNPTIDKVNVPVCKTAPINPTGGHGRVATGWTTGVRFPAGAGKVFLPFATAVSWSALGPTQPPIQWVPEALSLRVKRPGHEANHSPPFNAEVKNP
jgi:hypothetical protein